MAGVERRGIFGISPPFGRFIARDRLIHHHVHPSTSIPSPLKNGLLVKIATDILDRGDSTSPGSLFSQCLTKIPHPGHQNGPPGHLTSLWDDETVAGLTLLMGRPDSASLAGRRSESPGRMPVLRIGSSISHHIANDGFGHIATTANAQLSMMIFDALCPTRIPPRQGLRPSFSIFPPHFLHKSSSS